MTLFTHVGRFNNQRKKKKPTSIWVVRIGGKYKSYIIHAVQVRFGLFGETTSLNNPNVN